MKPLKFISFLFIITIVSACSILDSNSNPSQIIGQWEWFRSTGGFIGEKITPDSSGIPNQHIIFKSNFTFSFFRDSTLETSGKYSFNKNDGETVISYSTDKENFFSNQTVRFQGRDTLILADKCFDCYINYYTRNK